MWEEHDGSSDEDAAMMRQLQQEESDEDGQDDQKAEVGLVVVDLVQPQKEGVETVTIPVVNMSDIKNQLKLPDGKAAVACQTPCACAVLICTEGDSVQARDAKLGRSSPALRLKAEVNLLMLQTVDSEHPAVRQAETAIRQLEEEGQMSLCVEWLDGEVCATCGPGLDCMCMCELVVKFRGQEVARVLGHEGGPLDVSFSVKSAAPGENFIASLRWSGGTSYLHIPTPPFCRVLLPINDVLAPPRIAHISGDSDDLRSHDETLAFEPLPSAEWLLRPLSAGWTRSQASKSAILRGFGIEIEATTFAPNPEASGCFTKSEEMGRMLELVLQRVGMGEGKSQRCIQAHEGEAGACVELVSGERGAEWGAEWEAESVTEQVKTREHERVGLGVGDELLGNGAHSQKTDNEQWERKVPESARAPDELLSCLLRRCRRWCVGVDSHVLPAAPAVAEHIVAQLEEIHKPRQDGVVVESPAAQPDSVKGACLRLLLGGAHTMKSEFKSPPPPHDLRFSTGGGAEIGLYVKMLRHMGAACPPLSATGGGGCCSVHIHVNVFNAAAGGSILTCRQVLCVFLAWVRFDLVTSRFARPWMWREPSAAPLYATGAEFTWGERPWEQGRSGAERRGYDVPLFLKRVRALMRSPAYADMSESERMQQLFGRGNASAVAALGRSCSMNLRRLTSYGTMEVRRFHGCLNEAVLVRWAAFCVAFVERFHGQDGEERHDLTAGHHDGDGDGDGVRDTVRDAACECVRVGPVGVVGLSDAARVRPSTYTGVASDDDDAYCANLVLDADSDEAALRILQQQQEDASLDDLMKLMAPLIQPESLRFLLDHAAGTCV